MKKAEVLLLINGTDKFALETVRKGQADIFIT